MAPRTAPESSADGGTPPTVPVSSKADIDGTNSFLARMDDDSGRSKRQVDSDAATGAPPRMRTQLSHTWDTLTAAALIFTAIVTPYEIGFLDLAFDMLWYLNRVVDLIFICDVISFFFRPYFDIDAGRWVHQQHLITRRYLHGWFSVDLVSAIPFDLIALSGGSDEFVRIIRVLKLLKLLRMIQAVRKLKRWQEEVLTLSHGVFSALQLITLLTLTSHWFACVWGLTGRTMNEKYNDSSWITALEESKGRKFDTPIRQYVASLYMSVMTITTVGYGDVGGIREEELWVATGMMIVGTMIFAYLIGELVSVVGLINEDENVFKQSLDELNVMMIEANLPKDLCKELRAYMIHAKRLRRIQRYEKIFAALSPTMQGEVAWHAHRVWLP
jgi:hypothetical protein